MPVCMYLYMFVLRMYEYYTRMCACVCMNVHIYGKEKTLSTEEGSTRSHCVQNSLWKGLWTGRMTDCGMMNE
jgi:hypothetical protein